MVKKITGIVGALFSIAIIVGHTLTTQAAAAPLLGVVTSTPQTFKQATLLTPNINTCYLVWGNSISGHCQILSGSQLIVEIGEPGQGTVPSLSNIAAGSADTWLKSLATSLQGTATHSLLAFDAEANQQDPAVVPSQYIAAFDHVATIMGPKVSMVYQVAQDQSYTKTVRSLWPGAAYVNYMAIDGYYGQVASGDWTYQTVFGNTISQLEALSNDPVEITEAGVPATGEPAGDTQASLITNMLNGARAQSHVVGIEYFDQDTWSIDNNSAALANYKAGIQGW